LRMSRVNAEDTRGMHAIWGSYYLTSAVHLD
jgi:hypothetical protein